MANSLNSISFVMVRVQASSSVDDEFKPLFGQTRHKIGISCFCVKHHEITEQMDWLRIRMCPSGATGLRPDLLM